jgi:hypothetical protein
MWHILGLVLVLGAGAFITTVPLRSKSSDPEYATLGDLIQIAVGIVAFIPGVLLLFS